MPCGALKIYPVLPGFLMLNAALVHYEFHGALMGPITLRKSAKGVVAFRAQIRLKEDLLRVQDVHAACPCAGMVTPPRIGDRGGSVHWPAYARSRNSQAHTAGLCQRCKRHRGMGRSTFVYMSQSSDRRLRIYKPSPASRPSNFYSIALI